MLNHPPQHLRQIISLKFDILRHTPDNLGLAMTFIIVLFEIILLQIHNHSEIQ